MPAQMYVMAVIGTVAAAILFKELVYEPHIAPNVERWAGQFIAHREARRRQRAAPAPAHAPQSAARPRRRTASDGESGAAQAGVELEHLGAREVDAWLSNVSRSQAALTHRKPPRLDSPSAAVQYAPSSPTHVLFDPASPVTPTSAPGSPVAHTGAPGALRSPGAPARPLSPGVLTDASIIASYEVALASASSRSTLALESASASPFSSRAQSPFAAAPQGVLFAAPLSELDFLSDSSAESFAVRSASDAFVGGSVDGDDFDVRSTSSWASAIV